MPKVSIVIPTYNRRELVQQAIDSALAQTYLDREIIVVDDGSTDGTKEVLAARYVASLRYIWQQNQGESVARNVAIGVAHGEYVALLDSDDAWLPNKLERQVAVLAERPEVAASFCQAWLLDAEGQKLDMPPLGIKLTNGDVSVEQLCIQNEFVASTAVMRRSALEKVGGFDGEIRFGEDWDLWLRLRLKYRVHFLPEPLALIRKQPDNQCHLPGREHIGRALNDHLRMLGKAFSSLDATSEAIDHVRNRARARQYAEAAFASYAWSQWEEGRAYLKRACDLDPTLEQNTDYLTRMVVNYGISIARVEHLFRLERMREYLHGTLSHLPAGLHFPLGAFNRILGKLWAEEAYLAYLCGDRRRTRYCTWQAFRANPFLANDRGMLRRLLVSVF